MKNIKATIFGIFIFFLFFVAALLIDQNDILSDVGKLGVISLIALMFLAGTLDGFNPCAFNTLLLWSGFLLNRFGTVIDKENVLEKRKIIISYALIYSLGIFVVYFLLGIGFLNTINLTSKFFTTLFSQIMAFIVIILGITMIRDSWLPSDKAIIKMPKFLHPLYKKYSEPTTKLSAFLNGIVVGLCAVPCGGAVYMGVLIIIQNNSFMTKYPLLLVYNIGFIVPVLILAFTLANKKMLQSLSREFIRFRRKIKIILAIITIVLGLLSIYLA